MFKNILVLLDGSKRAERILSQVERLARIRDAEITLLRVAMPSFLSGDDPAMNESTAVRHAEEYLEKVKVRLKSSGLKVTSMVLSGDSAQKIMGYTRNFQGDLPWSHRTGV